MTLTFTNMAWPEDPYGTGQLWRQEPRLLAGFSIAGTTAAGHWAPTSYAVAYLRLHRTQAVDLTDGVSFGFRAAVAVTCGEVPDLVHLLDLDALRARRLAKVVTGLSLGRDLRNVIACTGGEAGRGLRGLAGSWDLANRDSPELAQVFDIADQSPETGTDLAVAAKGAGIDVRTLTHALVPNETIDEIVRAAYEQRARQALNSQSEWLATLATERALVCALIASRLLGSHTWHGLLDISDAMASNTWDCYPSQDFDSTLAGKGSR